MKNKFFVVVTTMVLATLAACVDTTTLSTTTSTVTFTSSASPTTMPSPTTIIPTPTTPILTTPTLAITPTTMLLQWEQRLDDVSGDEYLIPPPDVETAVREAFEAVLSLEVIEDRPNKEALAFDNNAALAWAKMLAAEDVVEHYADLSYVQLGTMGPKNPVQCQDYDTCKIAQAKLGVVAYVIYDSEKCAVLDEGILAKYKGTNGSFLLAGDGSHCMTRFVENDEPYASYLATVEFDSDQWIVTNLEREAIPEPSEN